MRSVFTHVLGFSASQAVQMLMDFGVNVWRYESTWFFLFVPYHWLYVSCACNFSSH